MAFYDTCPECGAHLDPGERCTCRDEGRERPWRAGVEVMEEPDGQYAFRWPAGNMPREGGGSGWM